MYTLGMDNTGLKGTLDDAFALAEKLCRELRDAHGIAIDNHSAEVRKDTLRLFDDAYELSSHIYNLSEALRA